MKTGDVESPVFVCGIMPTMELLFSYGTLRFEDVQLDTFGRMLNGKQAALIGYRVVSIKIRDQGFIAKNGAGPQNNLQYTGNASDIVQGAVLELTQEELELADTYEPAEYKRKLVQLKSGVQAWVYLTKSE